jgi:DNA repair protein RadC
MTMRSLIREIPEHDRPRERLERLGAENLTDAELLAVLLRTGRKGVSAVELGDSLLKRFGNLEEIGRRTVSEIASVSGLGPAKATLLKAAFGLHERVQRQTMQHQPLDNPAQIYKLMGERVRFLTVEVLYGLALDSKLRLVRCYEVTSGLLNQTLVHAREVFREAIAASAAHLVLVHNHPSGDPKPSPDDLRSTKELVQAGKIVGIPLLDHVIIGRSSEMNPSGFVSLKQMGIIG